MGASPRGRILWPARLSLLLVACRLPPSLPDHRATPTAIREVLKERETEILEAEANIRARKEVYADAINRATTDAKLIRELVDENKILQAKIDEIEKPVEVERDFGSVTTKKKDVM